MVECIDFRFQHFHTCHQTKRAEEVIIVLHATCQNNAIRQSSQIIHSLLTKSQPQTPPYTILDLGLVLGTPVAPHLCCFHVRGTLIVRLGEHAHDADEDLFHRLDGGPALRGVFVVVWVVAGWMEDGDAD